MQLNSQNEKKIDLYIKNCKDCKLSYPERVRIKDKMVELDVFRLPLDHLFYNVQNGRFAKEYLTKKRELNRDLNSEDPADIKEIEKMLREQNPKKTEWLKDNLREEQQIEPGIITHDGYVINGNRRMSVLNLLAKEDTKFGYMNVGRLPKTGVDESDIYKIEIGKQMAREQKLDYGPMNELLKIDHGLKSHLNKEQLAKTIGFSVKEIEKKVSRLELIKEYLQFIGEPENFEEAENLNEHFIDLEDYIFFETKKKKHQFTPIEIIKIKDIAFSLIKNKIPHLELRKIPKIASNPKIKKHFFDATKHITTNPQKTRDTYQVCQTRLAAEQSKEKPGMILDSILGNLDALDFNHPHLKKDYETTIKKIIKYQDDLKKVIQ